jgi:hypothetical protein
MRAIAAVTRTTASPAVAATRFSSSARLTGPS